MAIFSDSDFSHNNESSDDDFNMSDHDSDDDEDLVHTENAKTKAVREGFSLNKTENSISPHGKENGKKDEWLSTQPPSQSATRNRRVSPRSSGNKPKGITGAIVGAIKGETESLVIPKKKKAPPKQQQQATVPSTTADQDMTKTKTQSQQPPMKKRKVSLSPTDSLAKKSTVTLSKDEAKRKQVIDLLLDDDSDSDDEILAFKTHRTTTKPDILPQRLSPSMLAAASKQQKEHVEATKQKQKTERANAATNISETKATKGPLSKVSGTSYQEQTAEAKAATSLSRNENPKTQQTDPKNDLASISTNGAKANKKQKNTVPKTSKTDESKTTETKSKKLETKDTKTAAKTNNTEMATQSEQQKSKKKRPKTSTTTKSAKAENTNTAKPSATNESEEATKSAPRKATTATQKKKDSKPEAVAPKSKATKPTVKPTADKPPPKKKKKRKTFEDELLQKMFMTCRPYGIRDLVQLMGKTTSEASVNFCLLSLIDKKWVIKKEFKSGNRTKELYWANQESKDKRLWALECLQLPSTETIRETRLELASLQQQQKSLAHEIEQVEKTPSNDQLAQLCQSAQTQVNELSAKLEAMKQRIASSSSSSSSSSLSASKKTPLGGAARFGAGRNSNLLYNNKPKKARRTPLQLKKKINSMRDHWIKRKRKCMDFCDALADGMEKKVKDVVNKVLELETDESENAVLPPKHVVWGTCIY